MLPLPSGASVINNSLAKQRYVDKLNLRQLDAKGLPKHWHVKGNCLSQSSLIHARIDSIYPSMSLYEFYEDWLHLPKSEIYGIVQQQFSLQRHEQEE